MYKRKKTGEREIHLHIWTNTKDPRCECCGKKLGNYPSPIFFSHIIPKSRRSDLRLDPNNFELLCAEHHQVWEFGTIDQIKKLNHTQRKKDYMEKHDYLRWEKLFGDKEGDI